MRIIKVDKEEYFKLDGCTILKAKGKNVYKIVPIEQKQEDIQKKGFQKDISDLMDIVKTYLSDV